MNRIMFSYNSTFIGPSYKFYAYWNDEEEIINYEFESSCPDYSNKGSLDKKKSNLFLEKFYQFEDNRLSCETEINDDMRLLDAPTYQLLLSQGLRDLELIEWGRVVVNYDVTPILDAINICDNKIKL